MGTSPTVFSVWFRWLVGAQLPVFCRDQDAGVRGLFPEGRIPWLPVRLNAFLDIVGEVVIREGVRSARFQIRDHFRDHAARGLRLFPDGHKPVIFTFNDDLSYPLDVFEYGTNIVTKFAFCNADCRHTFDHSGPWRSSSSAAEAENTSALAASSVRERLARLSDFPLEPLDPRRHRPRAYRCGLGRCSAR